MDSNAEPVEVSQKNFESMNERVSEQQFDEYKNATLELPSHTEE